MLGMASRAGAHQHSMVSTKQALMPEPTGWLAPVRRLAHAKTNQARAAPISPAVMPAGHTDAGALRCREAQTKVSSGAAAELNDMLSTRSPRSAMTEVYVVAMGVSHTLV